MTTEQTLEAILAEIKKLNKTFQEINNVLNPGKQVFTNKKKELITEHEDDKRN